MALTVRGIWVMLAAAALATIAIPWYLVARTLQNAEPVPSSVVAGGVIWADRVFPSRGPLAHWLHVRGVAYSVWASRHPPAAARIKKD
jgi:hypothetical protein